MGCDHQGEESEGNCPPPTPGAGYRRLVPAPRFGLSSGGSLVRDGYEGTCRRMWVAAPCENSGSCRAVFRLLESAPAGGGKNQLTQNCCGLPPLCRWYWEQFRENLAGRLFVQNFAIFWLRVGIDICSTLHAMVALLRCRDVSPSVANTGEYFVCIRGPIYCRVRPFRRVASGASGHLPTSISPAGDNESRGDETPPCLALQRF